MKLTPELVEHYYRTRLDASRIHHTKGFEWRSKCPIHGSDNASTLKIDVSEGWFICFGCGVKGNSAFAFEQEMQRIEKGFVPEFGIIKESVAHVLGTPLTERVYPLPQGKPTGKGEGWDRKRAQARYVYTDEIGEEQFSVWRFVDRTGKKATPPDMPCPCKQNPESECPHGCQNGRLWGSKGARRVLYRLTDVIQSSLVFVVEGERNVDDLSRALAGFIKKKGGFQFGGLVLDRVGVTTNPGGATAWKKEYGYGKYFQGKVVIKLGDNDGPGRVHDEAVCTDVAPYAHKLFKMPLPVGEGEDISDYLEHNTFDSFLRLMTKSVPWQLPVPHIVTVKDQLEDRTLLVKPSELTRDATDTGNWLIPGFIEHGTRGLVVAPPKAGKSILFLDLAISLACKQSFLSMNKPSREYKVAIISREDGPVMVKRRLSQLALGRNLGQADIDRNIRVNTIDQSSSFRIDCQKDLEEMARWLRMMEIEFTVIDVLNKLHGGEENSSTDMTRVMGKFDELAKLSGSQICVIHHTSRSGGVKGSTSIEGWADFICRLEVEPDDESVKILHTKTKSSGPLAPKRIRYYQSPDERESKIQLLVPG